MCLGSLICFILTIFIYKYLLLRVSILKNERKGFYECGFKPNIQKPIQISLQFFMISVLFILFDTDLLFLYPLVASLSFYVYLDIIFFIFILFLIYVSLVYEKYNNSFIWKY